MENKYKVAVVTDNKKNLSRHFGKAKYFMVYEMDGNTFNEVETIEKPKHEGSHQHHDHSKPVEISVEFKGHGGEDHHHEHEHKGFNHDDMMVPIKGCKYVIAGGIGAGAKDGLMNMNIKPIITDLRSIEEALEALVKGELKP